MRLWPLAGLALLGCATTTHVVRLSPTTYESKSAGSPVQLYSAKLPSCPFEEIGIVRARKEIDVVSDDALVDALREKARELGGDALVRISFVAKSDLAATVIRFKQDGCRQ
jgi:hypothetical protein